MAKPQSKAQRVRQIALTIFVLVGAALIVADLAGNISYELASNRQPEAVVQEVTPTPIPTLTESERQDLLKTPVGEDF